MARHCRGGGGRGVCVRVCVCVCVCVSVCVREIECCGALGTGGGPCDLAEGSERGRGLRWCEPAEV